MEGSLSAPSAVHSLVVDQSGTSRTPRALRDLRGCPFVSGFLLGYPMSHPVSHPLSHRLSPGLPGFRVTVPSRGWVRDGVAVGRPVGREQC